MSVSNRLTRIIVKREIKPEILPFNSKCRQAAVQPVKFVMKEINKYANYHNYYPRQYKVFSVC
jgi:hypothetical protein